MSSIIQLKDSNGNNIYPVAYVSGGVKMDLLWTNPNPTASFAAQTISLDLSNYSFLFIRFKAASGATYSRTDLILKNVSNQFLNSASDYHYYRQISQVDDSGIIFLSGYRVASYGGSGTADNTYGIPLEIYGVKISYIVPTTVQGLQYVELVNNESSEL